MQLVVGYRHTGIIVQDMEKSLQFYRDILELEVIQDYSDESDFINTVLGLNGACIRMVKLKSKDGNIIELLKYTNHPTEKLDLPFYNVGICHIAFTVTDLNKIYEKIEREGFEIISKPLLGSEKIAKVFFCVDPNGMRIELVQMINKKK
tara:strand:- start:178 stop:624 length:447 start_codon:yes stop_codon:yes gene_type:complete